MRIVILSSFWKREPQRICTVDVKIDGMEVKEYAESSGFDRNTALALWLGRSYIRKSATSYLSWGCRVG
jgi:hypothetical protein